MATSAQTANATDQVRQDFQYSSTVDGLLKNVYIPALNNTTFHATPLMEMFGDFGGVIDFASNKIIKAFKHQGAGGFGGIPEGGSFVAGRDQKGFQGEERLRYLNAFVSLTGPAAKTVKAGAGAFVDAVSSAMDDTLKLARMNMERIIGGAGNGLVGTFTLATANLVAATAKSATFTTGTGGYSPCQWLQEGMRCQIYSNVTSSPAIVADDSAVWDEVVVSNIDYKAGTADLTSPTAYTLTASTTYYLTVENAYGDVEADGTVTADSCLEPNGLTNLVSDGSSTGETNYTTIWGRTRSTYAHSLKSQVELAASAELDEELLIGYILNLINYTQNIPNVLVTDPRSRLKYFSNRKEDRRFDMPVIDTVFGFKSIGVTIDQYTLILQSLTSLLPGTMFMLNTGDFKFAKATNGFEWQELGGRIFRPYETKDAIFATALNYMNFVCENPRGQLKVTGLSY